MKFTNKPFKKETVNLNGNQFDHCTFINCELIFNGVGSVGLTNCSFNHCRWTFQGPAADTVAFMKALYSMGGGGKDLIVQTFNDIAPDMKLRH